MPLSDWSLLVALEAFRQEISYITVNRSEYERMLRENPVQEAEVLKQQENQRRQILTSPEVLIGQFKIRSAALSELGNYKPFMEALQAQKPDLAADFRAMLKEFSDKPTLDDLSDDEMIAVLKLDLAENPTEKVRAFKQWRQQACAVLGYKMVAQLG